MSTAAGTAAARPTSSDSAGAASSEVRPPLPPPPELSAADQARLAEALADNPIVTHVPPGADLAVQVRVGRVVKSDMWARASAPDVGLTRSLTSLVPLPIDFEKDVAVALLIFECEAGVSPSSPQLHGALALETLRPLALADLLPPTAHAVHMAGLGADAYPLEGGLYVASPSPRLILIATDLPYLVRIAKPHAWQGTEDLLTAGEVAFAARPSAALKEMIRGDAAAMQAKNLKAGITGADLARFALDYNLIRLALETESVAGSIDLMREADAGHMEVRFASKSMALFATALAQALTDPLAMGLPALMGGTPLEEAPAEPLYRVRPVGDKVLVTMSRKAATALVERLCDTARQTAGRRASADHLRTLGAAIRTYVTVHQAYPKTWSDLVGPGLVHEMALFENPALKNHPPAGDYELVPMTKESAARRSWDKVLAYEAPSPEPPAQEALNVLFADGHVEYMDMAKFQQLYRMTIESLGH
jgi:prepilin-type processing-associated H-X9-DG protein